VERPGKEKVTIKRKTSDSLREIHAADLKSWEDQGLIHKQRRGGVLRKKGSF